MTKKQKKQNIRGKKDAGHLRERLRKSQRGQILIIVVFSIIGLVALVGLVVDTGLVFVGNGKLRRATDAAALAAAAEYRKSPSATALSLDAKEYLTLNNIDQATATVHLICNTSDALYDATQCYPAKRRLVRVDASSTINLAFLPVLGIRTVTLNATATSEAAALDIVMLMDVSESMTWSNVNSAGQSTSIMADPVECNVPDVDGYTNCEPFKDIQKAAVQFVADRFPSDGSNEYDRVAVIPFDRIAHSVVQGQYNDPFHLSAQTSYTSTQYRQAIMSKIKGLRVFTASGTAATGGPLTDGSCLNASGGIQYPTSAPCRYYPYKGDGYCLSDDDIPLSLTDPVTPTEDSFDDLSCFTPDGSGPYVRPSNGAHYQRAYDLFACPPSVSAANCGTTNTGDALRAAGQEFVIPAGFRQQSLWIVILLTDGVANHSENNNYCPNSTGALCQDNSVKTYSSGTRHCRTSGDALYAGNPFLYTFCTANTLSDGGGGGVVNTAAYDADDYARDMADFVALGQSALIYTIGFGNEVKAHGDMGEQLLNYAADVGDDGKIDTSDTPAGTLNSDYFFAPDAAHLQQIFKTINDRIATRLTQ